VLCFFFSIPVRTKTYSLPQSQDIDQLFGWIADVRRVRQFIPNFNRQPSNQIYVLPDEQTSRQAILESLQWLALELCPKTICRFVSKKS
jgi:hypothetical protein